MMERGCRSAGRGMHAYVRCWMGRVRDIPGASVLSHAVSGSTSFIETLESKVSHRRVGPSASEPQGLKRVSLLRLSGTAEAVSFPKPYMRGVVSASWVLLFHGPRTDYSCCSLLVWSLTSPSL